MLFIKSHFKYNDNAYAERNRMGKAIQHNHQEKARVDISISDKAYSEQGKFSRTEKRITK